MNSSSKLQLSHIQRNAVVRLKSQKKYSHPWIFQRSIEKSLDSAKNAKPQNGSIVEVYDSEGQWVGRGIYNGHARIALRILTENQDELIDREFFYSRLQTAFELRHHVLKISEKTNAFRLCHSEGDRLSGLVIEKYANHLVVEYFSSGMYRLRSIIESVLRELFPSHEIFFFADEHVQKQESIDVRSPPPPEPFEIIEHGLSFYVAPGGRHKTGFFLDQRDNRAYLKTLLQPGTLLDLCCNSGGFAIYGASHPAIDAVTALDLDEVVLNLARRNAKLNSAYFPSKKIEWVHVDIFPWLREAIAQGKQFNNVVLDPAKQTRNREDVSVALRKYCDMNRLALQVTKPGGLFVTCSCTGLVSEQEFVESVRRAAYQANREVQIFNVTGAAPDHPFSIQVAEGRYLKAVWARVL